jgi:hypothetical protein
MKESFEDPSELDGFDELPEADQQRVIKAYEDGHVADEDIPETARKPEGEEDEEEEEEKPKKKRASKKKADDGDEEKPAKAKKATKKVCL